MRDIAQSNNNIKFFTKIWKSIGDKSDIEHHDEQKHPRKINTNSYLIAILLLNFIVESFTFREVLGNPFSSNELYNIIETVVNLSSIVAVLALVILKYAKNNRELDCGLLLLLFLLTSINLL